MGLFDSIFSDFKKPLAGLAEGARGFLELNNARERKVGDLESQVKALTSQLESSKKSNVGSFGGSNGGERSMRRQIEPVIEDNDEEEAPAPPPRRVKRFSQPMGYYDFHKYDNLRNSVLGKAEF